MHKLFDMCRISPNCALCIMHYALSFKQEKTTWEWMNKQNKEKRWPVTVKGVKYANLPLQGIWNLCNMFLFGSEKCHLLCHLHVGPLCHLLGLLHIHIQHHVNAPLPHPLSPTPLVTLNDHHHHISPEGRSLGGLGEAPWACQRWWRMGRSWSIHSIIYKPSRLNGDANDDTMMITVMVIT